MKRLFALGIVAAALTLTGCAASAEAAYLEEAPNASDVPYSDKELLAIGNQICDSLRDGGGALAFADIAMTNKLDGYALGFLSSQATQHLCPDQAEAMKKLAEQLSNLDPNAP